MEIFTCNVDCDRRATTYAVGMAASLAVPAAAIAAEIRRRLPGVGTKKLHKLLYYCQGHHLAATGEPLFRESVSAWDMGPVVGQLWRAEKDGGEPTSDSGADVPDGLDVHQLNTIGYVLSRYGALTGQDLEALTHSEPPWRRADESRTPGDTARIEQEWMLEFFRSAEAMDDEDPSSRLDPAEVRAWLAGSSKPASGVEDTVDMLRARLRG